MASGSNSIFKSGTCQIGIFKYWLHKSVSLKKKLEQIYRSIQHD